MLRLGLRYLQFDGNDLIGFDRLPDTLLTTINFDGVRYRTAELQDAEDRRNHGIGEVGFR